MSLGLLKTRPRTSWHWVPVLFLLLFSIVAHATVVSDSLYRSWTNTTLSDSVRIQSVSKLVWSLMDTNIDSAEALSTAALTYSQQHHFRPGIARCFNQLGVIRYYQGKYDQADSCLKVSLAINDELDSDKGRTTAWGNLAQVAQERGDFATAVDYIRQSLKVEEANGDTAGIASTLHSIGSIYLSQDDFEAARDYLNRSLQLHTRLGDSTRMAFNLINMGIAYYEPGRYSQAREVIIRSISLLDDLGLEYGMGTALLTLGICEWRLGRIGPAEFWLDRSLEVARASGEKVVIADCLNTIGAIALEQGKEQQALKLCTEALDLAREIGSAVEMHSATEQLYQVYKELGQPAMALEMHELFVELEDSLMGSENERKLLELSFAAQMQQQRELDSLALVQEQALHRAELARQEAVIRSERLWGTGLWVGLGLLGALAAVLWWSVRRKRLDHYIIKAQKEQVEQQRDEIQRQNEQLFEQNRDMSQFNRKLEEQVDQRTRQLRISLERLRQHQYRLSHNIRGPLSSVLGLLSLLKEEDPDHNREVIQHLKDQTEKLDEVIHTIARGGENPMVKEALTKVEEELVRRTGS